MEHSMEAIVSSNDPAFIVEKDNSEG